MAPNGTARIQIDIPLARQAEIRKIMDDAEFNSYRELFDNMFTLFRWVMKQAADGRLIVSLDEPAEKFTEVQMPFLQRLQERAKQKAAA
jgi:deoxyadenosine/deoxycytidine kinase